MTTAQPIKRRRACGPKVKTGCNTCKIRRVKCDEGKPACQRCTSTGRSCDGYLQVASSPGSSSSSSDEGPNLDIVRKITTISGTTQERRGFQYFLTKTAADLSGYFTSSFWEHLILQAGVAEPSLRHSIIAIGSLHEAFAQNRPILGGKYDTDIGFATSQYGKAIGHLRRSLANGNQEPITALMSCILFVCFDSLRGHLASAMVHLQSGLKILRDIRARPDVDTHIIKTHITPIFLRLSIQSILYLDTKRKQERQQFATDLMNGSPDDQEIPEAFECLEDARASMSRAVDGLFRMFYLCDGDKPMSEQSPEAFILYEKYSTQLRQWSGAFDAFLTAQSSRLTTREVRGAALLKIHHTTIRIMAEITPDINDPRPASYSMNEPESFKRFDAEFLNIINLSRSLIAATEADIKAGKSPLNFSTDLGLVAPIYYTCVKCQRPGIRNAAMELLERLPRKEGMWDDVSCAKLIKEFWKIEARHKKLQEMNPAFETTIPINALVDLDVKDGMEFEWKWRGPTDEVPFMTDPIQLVGLNNGRLP